MTRYEIPDDAPVYRCSYCDRPFAEEHLLELHHGVDHNDQISESERETFQQAFADENDEVRRYRIIALGLLVLLYFGLLMIFALV